MVSLFISMLNPIHEENVSGYQIDVNQYAKAMRLNWPDAHVYEPDGSTYRLRWELSTEGILGGLQADRKSVSFGINYVGSALQFIVWHRQYVPSDVELFLFDDNLILIHRLTSDDRKKDLENLIRSELSN